MKADVIVLGAGIIGICTALHLQRRGLDVVVVDRQEPGNGASYGNAGIIERSSVYPYSFPRSFREFARLATNRTSALRYEPSYLVRNAKFLFNYWRASAPSKLEAIARSLLPLIEASVREHEILIDESASDHLVQARGWVSVFRSQSSFARGRRAAAGLSRFSLRYEVLGGREVAALEPAIRTGSINLPGAIHWQDPKTVTDPRALVQRYAELFKNGGGRFEIADACKVAREGGRWNLPHESGVLSGDRIVVALGAHSPLLLRQFGYTLPMAVKRGYHMHYGPNENSPSHTLVDEEGGFVLAPMTQGLRLATGVELAGLTSKPNYSQIRQAARLANQLVSLGPPIESTPWLGLRPCFADMCPTIGEISGSQGIWVNFGHAHHGLTLGPVSGKILADLMTVGTSFVDASPFRPDRH